MLFKKPRFYHVFAVSALLLCSLASNSQEQPDSLIKKNSSPRTVYAMPEADPSETKSGVKGPGATLEKKANKLYYNKAFQSAIPFYEKLRTMDSTDEQTLSRLAECYRLTNNLPGQLLVYGSLVRQSKAQAIEELYYGQALMQNGEMESARPYLEKYSADSRGKNLAASFAKQKVYARNSDAYVVKLAAFNSPYNDMCAVKFDSAVVFASTRPNNKWIVRNQNWTGGSYTNVFATEKDEKGLEKKPMLFLKSLRTKFNTGPVCFNKDQYMIYYTMNHALKNEKARDGNYKLMILEGELDLDGLMMVRQPSFINKEYNYAHPSLSADGKTLYFASDQDGGMGGMDIYRSEKDATGSWGPAINLGELVNTAGNEVFPFIAAKGNLFFSSNGHDGLGGLDIYEVRMRDNKPVKLYNMGVPVNSAFDDFGIFIEAGGKAGYISSNRQSGGQNDDIYELEILREIRRGKEVLIRTKDKLTGLPVANARLLVERDTVFTNDSGEYTTIIDEEAVIKVKTLKEDCFEIKDTISARASAEDQIVKELFLEDNPKLFLHGIITDAKTGEPLNGVNIRITEINDGNDVDRYTTTPNGDYFKFLFDGRIGDQLAYLIKLEKNGYLSRSLIFNHIVEKPGEIDMNKLVNLSLGKVELGMDLGKLIDLQPIYFDVGKSKIRPDAAAELDKIVEVMNLYPTMSIELGSHTDCRSSAASNMKLSAARAASSKDYIVKKGINKLRITAKGFGETRLLNDCACEGKVVNTCPDEVHAKNRRTEFLITRIQ